MNHNIDDKNNIQNPMQAPKTAQPSKNKLGVQTKAFELLTKAQKWLINQYHYIKAAISPKATKTGEKIDAVVARSSLTTEEKQSYENLKSSLKTCMIYSDSDMGDLKYGYIMAREVVDKNNASLNDLMKEAEQLWDVADKKLEKVRNRVMEDAPVYKDSTEVTYKRINDSEIKEFQIQVKESELFLKQAAYKFLTVISESTKDPKKQLEYGRFLLQLGDEIETLNTELAVLKSSS